MENGSVNYMGDVGKTVDLYLKDNTFKADQLLNCLKYKTSLFHIDFIAFNGSSLISVKIDKDNRTVIIQVEGEAFSDIGLEQDA